VQDTLAESNRYNTVFEPLHPDAVPGAAAIANRYVRPGAADAQLRAFMDKALHGQTAKIWTGLRARPDRLLPPLRQLASLQGLRSTRANYAKALARWRQVRGLKGRPQIVKFIRGNLLANWLVEQFPYPAAIIVRHPCAVLSSVMQRHGDEWQLDAMRALLERYLVQTTLVDDRLAGISDRLRDISSLAAIHTATWCIENAWFLTHPLQSGLSLFFYEDLVTNTKLEWQRLADALGLEQVPDQALLSRPSQQASYRALRKTSTSEFLGNWQSTLASDELDDVAAILRIFGVTAYDTASMLPLHKIG
jgi:hypothetical protein